MTELKPTRKRYFFFWHDYDRGQHWDDVMAESDEEAMDHFTRSEHEVYMGPWMAGGDSCKLVREAYERAEKAWREARDAVRLSEREFADRREYERLRAKYEGK